jgi:glycoprotein endo-alpha-1,2-mannosidase
MIPRPMMGNMIATDFINPTKLIFRARPLRLAAAVFLLSCWAQLSPATGVLEFAGLQRERHYTQVPHEVLAFYYTWYGRPPLHWGGVDADRHDIEQSRHYPARGAYDSHDPAMVDWQISLARSHGITGFIATWWGQGTYEDQAVPIALERARKRNFKVTIYWETAPGEGREQIDRAVSDLVYVLTRYGTNSAFLKVGGKPVIFVYGRVMEQVPLVSWPEIISATRAKTGDFLLIADGYSESYARIFDGVHTYNICGSVKGKNPDELRAWAARHYANAVKLARKQGRISCVTVIPGYDDTKIRKPGLNADRQDGRTYRVLWEEAVKSNPDWVLITSWNEWHEGSEIEPSFEDGDKYIRLTGDYAPHFRDSATIKPPASLSALDPAKIRQLRELYAGRTIGILPGSSGGAPFWLLDCGLKVRELTWAEATDSALFNPANFALVLDAGDEHYVGSVNAQGDVRQALIRYLNEGGFLVSIPSQPWPFYYDDKLGKPAPITTELGLPLSAGWEQPPAGVRLTFHADAGALPGLPASAAFPRTGDLRWRPATREGISPGDIYLSLAQLKDANGRSHGDGIACVERKSGGKAVYVWMRMTDVFGEDDCLFAVFKFAGAKLREHGGRRD